MNQAGDKTMASLKFLERDFPVIDSNFQQFCASHGIYTVKDFLLNDLYVLVAFAEQQFASDRLKQGINQVLSIIEGQHQPWSNGLKLLEDAQWNKHALSTGFEGIDLLLQGGFCKGQLTELVGSTSSGKTQVCLQAASYVAINHGRTVFIDTGNSFSANHISHLIVQTLDRASKKVEPEFLQNVMSRVTYHPVFDIVTLMNVLHQLDTELKSQAQTRHNQLHLIIVDSVSSLITAVLGGSGPHGHALMISVGYLLKKVAHEHNISVVVTNHMVSGEGSVLKPALGESWKCIPHVRILLSRDRGTNICHSSLIKHQSMASGKAASFKICR